MSLLDATNKISASSDHGLVQLSPFGSHTEKLPNKSHLLSLLGWQFAIDKDVADNLQLFAVTSAPHSELDAIFANVVVQDTAKMVSNINQHSTIVCTKRDLRNSNVIRLATPSSVSHDTEIAIGVEEAPEFGAPHTINHVGIVMPTNAHEEATRR